MLQRVKALVLVAIMTVSMTPFSAVTAMGSNSFDADRELLLELMDIQLDNSDALYTDADFVALVNSFGELNANIDKTAEDFIAILDSAIDFAEAMQEIDDPRFADYSISDEELEEMRAMVEELKAEFSQNGESFSQLLYSEFLNYDSYDYSQDLDWGSEEYNGGLTAYGYADVMWAVPGQEVTLYDYSSQSNYDTPSSVTWMQSVGPKADLYHEPGMFETDRKFIMPEFTGSDITYVEFNLMISQNGETAVYPVYVALDATGEMAIRHLYIDLLWREADPAGLDYWMNQYQNGVSIEEIKATFMQSEEYKNRM